MLTTEYIAGLFDGEGYLGLQISPEAKGKGKSYRFGIRPITKIEIGLLEQDDDVLDEIRGIYGGYLYRAQSVSLKGIVSKKKIWRLHAKSQCIKFLEDILPLLRIKRKVANIALQAFRLMVPPYSEEKMRLLIDLSFQISAVKPGHNRRHYTKEQLLKILEERAAWSAPSASPL